MKTKMMLKKIAVLVGMLTVLMSINSIGYCVVMEDGKDKTKLPIIEERGSLVRPDGLKKQEPEYAAGEVIIKLKEPAVSPETLFAQSYSVRKGSQDDILSNLKAKYNLKDEEPVFKGLHNQLKAKNLSLRQLNAQEEAKSPQQAAKKPQDAKQPNLLPIYILKTDKDVLETCNKLKQDPDVEYAEPNYIVEIQMLPNDPYYSTTGSWGQPYDDLWGIKKIQCEQAWDISQGEGVVVAVIDTGVDYNHEDIAQNIWINPGEIPDNRIDDDRNGYVDDVRGWDFVTYGDGVEDSDPMDDHGHGTHVSGTIAGIGNNNKGVIGVAPRAKIMGIKGFGASGSAPISDLVNCVIYAADNGANVLSNSWGGFGTSQVLTDAFHYADSKECVAVAAAGNANIDTSYFMPANIDTVMAIAATNQNDEKCDFSNYGNEIDTGAPGGDSSSGAGDNLWYRNILSLRSDNNGNPTDMYHDGVGIIGNKYYRSRGTSMACPHVSGVVALVLAAHPGVDNDAVMAIIGAGVDTYPQPPSVSLGIGRVNAYKAVTVTPRAIFKIMETNVQEFNGNKNKILESNEEMQLIVGLKNLWLDAASVTATLSTTNPYIAEITLPTSNFGGIAHSELKNNQDNPFVFKIGDIRFATEVVFTLTIHADGTEQILTLPVLLGVRKIASVNAATEVFSPIISRFNITPDSVWHNIVWHGTQDQLNYDIFVYDLAMEDTRKIGSASYLAWPVISGAKVAWAEAYIGEDGHSEIFLYDLLAQKGNFIPETSSYQIYGGENLPIALIENGVAWAGTMWAVYNSSYLWFHNWGEPVVAGQIGGPSAEWIYPGGSGTKIVWHEQDIDSGIYKIFVLDTLTGQKIGLPSDFDFGYSPSISGNKVVWAGYDAAGVSGLYLYGLETNQKRFITSTDIGGFISNITISGDKIAYWDIGGNERGDFDYILYLYDLSTDQKTQIFKYVGAFCSWSTPSISDNILVWQFNFNIYIADINPTNPPPGDDHTPRFDPITNKTVREAETLTFAVSATNPDGNPLDYSATNLPQGATFDPTTQVFEWTPDYDQAGYYAVTFTATDNEHPVSKTVLIRVDNTNRAPVFEPIYDIIGDEGTELTIYLNAIDPDGYYPNSITYSVLNRPQGAFLVTNEDGDTVTFYWTPNFAQAGIYSVTFIASDGDLSGSKTITITVNNAQDPGYILSLQDSPDPFNDMTTIRGSFIEIVDWQLNIVGPNGNRLKLFTGQGKTVNVEWWGYAGDDDQYLAPDGTYDYILTANGMGKSGTVTKDTTPPIVSNISASPNPFAPNIQTTTIYYNISESAYVTIKIYNSGDVLIKTLLSNSWKTTLNNSIIWNGKDTSGSYVLPGNYKIEVLASDKAKNSALYNGIIEVSYIPISILSLRDSPDPFSPNGDGVYDTTRISGKFNQIVRWIVEIKNASSEAVRTFSGVGTSASATWDGKGDSGALLPDGTYTYILTGTNPAGNSATQQGTITLKANPPPAPSSLTAQALSSTQIKLTWQDNSLDETGFKVEMSIDGVTFAYKAGTAANITTCTVGGLSPGTTYYFRIYSYNVAGKAYSEIIQGTTMPLPVAPSNLTTQALSSTQIKVMWQDNSLDETGFRVEMSSDGVTFAVKGSSASNVATCTIRYLSPNTTYSFRVYAIRGSDKSVYSEIIQGTTMSLPIAPSNLTTQALSSTQIKLSWQDNSLDETGFRVEVSADGTTFAVKGSALANITTCTIGRLTANTTYHFRAYSIRGADKSVYSEVIQGTTMPLPIAPSNLTAQALSSTQIKLTWQDNSNDETGFKIEQSTDGITFAYKGYVTADKTTFTASGLTSGTTYYYRAYAYRGYDKSTYSNVASGTTQ